MFSFITGKSGKCGKLTNFLRPFGHLGELGETDEADSKDSKRTAPSSSSAGKGIPFDMKESKGIYVAESKQVFGDQTEPSTSAIDQPKDAKETIGGSNI